MGSSPRPKLADMQKTSLCPHREKKNKREGREEQQRQEGSIKSYLHIFVPLGVLYSAASYKLSMFKDICNKG
jgi:hypothetical protein